jgi:scyllo-inositol 2-dehydrogenase (NADP+)
MIRTAMVGLGKMGLSHLAILRAHPDLDLVAGCDTSTYLNDVLIKYASLKCYDDFETMLEQEPLEALVVATPSKLHAPIVERALRKGLHVFCEKPFVLNIEDGQRLVSLVEAQKLVNQVGYHYRFVGAFKEAARIAKSGALGTIHNLRVEAYGPVVLRPKGSTWRSTKSEGGGALYDYACHAIDLTHFVVGVPASVGGVVRNQIFSRDVDDEVYCTFHYLDGASGQLCVNWSDESFRKMSVKISVWGTLGRLISDRQECQIYLREPHAALPHAGIGWTTHYTTDLTEPVWFYLRGEEYSAQIDYFAQSIKQRRLDGENTFRSALDADRIVSMILGETATHTSSSPTPHRGVLKRLLGRS